ncbi:MAG TPA: hypothetical protein V6D15_08490 [Oculatellaceae cyanobacterium]|jgi:hypothetical protein
MTKTTKKQPEVKFAPSDLGKYISRLQHPIDVSNGVNEAQSVIISIIDENWAIYADWILYERVPLININKYPYNTPKFQSRRRKAKILAHQIDLCKDCYDSFKGIKTQYESPMHYWLALMQERKNYEIELSFSQNSTSTKASYVSGWRSLLTTLQKHKKVPEVPPLHKVFFAYCLDLAWHPKRKSDKRKKFKDRLWEPFFIMIREYADYCEKNKKLKRVREDNNKLLILDRGRPQAFRYKIVTNTE